MLKRILILSITLVTGVVVGWYGHAISSGEDLRKSHASALSSSLSGDFKVIEALKEKGAFDAEIKSHYDERFSQLILSMQLINPNLYGLSASNTKPWCKLIQYHLENTISFNQSLDTAIDSYIMKIKPVIDSQMTDAQEFIGGAGCEIGKSNS